jgi:hypothetical protein
VFIQPGAQRGLARRGLAEAGGQHAAEQHFFDAGGAMPARSTAARIAGCPVAARSGFEVALQAAHGVRTALTMTMGSLARVMFIPPYLAAMRRRRRGGSPRR